MSIMGSYNKGEWSELYAFIRLLKDGKIYAANENVERIEDVYFPIIKLIREEVENHVMDYKSGDMIKIYKNNEYVDEIPVDVVAKHSELLFEKIFEGDNKQKGSFEIPELDFFLKKMKITKVKAPSSEKIDIKMQVQDINTGFSPIVGFSVKSDVGSPPTLLNAGKNTRLRYKVTGLTDDMIDEINSIDKSVCKEYMKARITRLFELADKVNFDRILDDKFNDNLVLIDSALPQIYGAMVLLHYRFINDGLNSCEILSSLLNELNPLHYHRSDIYHYKFKKMISASALGMTPGSVWDGMDAATGGYIIIKRDGDVLCYHLYNRNFFEEYLIKNTVFDRPSATRHDYGYLFKENGEVYINFNVQIRFKSISSANTEFDFNKEYTKYFEILKEMLI